MGAEDEKEDDFQGGRSNLNFAIHDFDADWLTHDEVREEARMFSEAAADQI